MRAIVVDDSRAIRMILKKILTSEGFDVIEAGHGVEALEQLEKSGYVEVALVDWNMPEMNGLELIEAVRSQPRYAGMRVMMVTTETEMSQVQKALAAGADEYIMKPFTPEGLHDKLGILGLVP